MSKRRLSPQARHTMGRIVAVPAGLAIFAVLAVAYLTLPGIVGSLLMVLANWFTGL